MTHHHEHHHDVTSDLTFEEKLIKLLEHWLKHNQDHAHTYQEWAGRAKAHDLLQAGCELDQWQAVFEAECPGLELPLQAQKRSEEVIVIKASKRSKSSRLRWGAAHAANPADTTAAAATVQRGHRKRAHRRRMRESEGEIGWHAACWYRGHRRVHARTQA